MSLFSVGSRLSTLLNPKKLPSKVKVLTRVATAYNDILVLQNDRTREIWFVRDENDFFLQSRINLDAPNSPVLIYSKMILASLLFQPEPKRVLTIGLGGAALTNFIHEWYPQTHIDVVEIDREVVKIAKKYFFFEEKENYLVHEEDGRVFLKNADARKKYDLVILDAFKSGSIPYHLKTREYYEEIHRLMAPGAVLASNLYGKSNKLKPRDWRTFSEVFGEVYFLEDPDEVATALIAVDQKVRWSPEKLQDVAEEFMAQKAFPFSLEEMASYYRLGKFEDGGAEAFVDDFSAQGFDQAVTRNNLNHTKKRDYPIRSFS